MTNGFIERPDRDRPGPWLDNLTTRPVSAIRCEGMQKKDQQQKPVSDGYRRVGSASNNNNVNDVQCTTITTSAAEAGCSWSSNNDSISSSLTSLTLPPRLPDIFHLSPPSTSNVASCTSPDAAAVVHTSPEVNQESFLFGLISPSPTTPVPTSSFPNPWSSNSQQQETYKSSGYVPFTSEQDYVGLKTVVNRLHDSNFYFEGLSSRQASEILENKPVGSFLVRDSSDPQHLFSVSLRTPRGTTSVRIEYKKGKFRFDAEACLKHKMPKFDCVVELINYYVSHGKAGHSQKRVWLDSTGRRDTPVKLTKPVFKEVPRLRHFCRRTICSKLSKKTKDTKELPLPNAMKDYLLEYPYAH